MPDLFEIMESCRAMRRLKPDPVPDELIAKILRAGLYAPNGGNTQRWRFLVVKDPKIKKAVQDLVQEGLRRGDRPALPIERAAAGQSTKEKYLRQHAAVEYLTDHYSRGAGLDRRLPRGRCHAEPDGRLVDLSGGAEHGLAGHGPWGWAPR